MKRRGRDLRFGQGGNLSVRVRSWKIKNCERNVRPNDRRIDMGEGWG